MMMMMMMVVVGVVVVVYGSRKFQLCGSCGTSYIAGKLLRIA